MARERLFKASWVVWVLSLDSAPLLWHRQRRNKGGACPSTSFLTDTDRLALAHPALGTPSWRLQPGVRTAKGAHW